jgi:hypothetical protein
MTWRWWLRRMKNLETRRRPGIITRSVIVQAHNTANAYPLPLAKAKLTEREIQITKLMKLRIDFATELPANISEVLRIKRYKGINAKVPVR